MSSLFGQISGLIGGSGNDPSKLEPFIVKGFSMFDKDGSGSIEGPEVTACVHKVLGMAGISNVPQSAIDSVFARVAGPDKRLDRAEFAALVKQLLGRLQGGQQ
eukprot:GHRQ01020458.1.p3 GENE.GHRQ01020458.1~~GHRQ01020458.1.p3  ORF type:complete len:103 (+),score=43.11 GHRQ01020458.1:133-441(+)